MQITMLYAHEHQYALNEAEYEQIDLELNALLGSSANISDLIQHTRRFLPGPQLVPL